jgi:hypothetical protein
MAIDRCAPRMKDSTGAAPASGSMSNVALPAAGTGSDRDEFAGAGTHPLASAHSAAHTSRSNQ